MREPYVTELAETVNTLFEGGTIDPSAQEIAEAHFPGKALGGEITEGIRKRLRGVRDALEIDYGLPVCLVNGTYFVRFRTSTPTTEADAKRCIPVGRAVTAAGIRLSTIDDLIYQAMLSQNLSAGAGKVKKSVDRTLDAVTDHRLDVSRAKLLIERARRRELPEKPKVMARVQRAALPAGSKK